MSQKETLLKSYGNSFIITFHEEPGAVHMEVGWPG